MILRANNSLHGFYAIIPFQNVLGKIDRLVAILNTCKQVNLILVADNCSDGSEKILAEIVSKNPNHTIVFTDSNSPGGARNVGLDSLPNDAKWISFWDSDDEVFIEGLIKSLEMKNSTVDVIVSSFVMQNEILNTSYKFNVQTDNYLETMYYPGIWRMIFNKNTIQSIRFPNQRIGEDVIFLTRIRFDKINKVYSENIVYKYFIGDNSHLSSSRMPPEVAYNYLCEILQGLESSIGFREDLSLMTLMRFLRLCLASRDMRWIFKSGCLLLRKTPKLVALSPQIVSILVRARKIKKKQLKMYS